MALGPIEEVFWTLGQQFGGARIAVVFQLAGYVDGALLSIALARVQHRHPKLRAPIVRGSDGRYAYQFDTPTPPIGVEMAEYDGEEAPWREAAARLLRAGFPAGGPLASAAVLRNHALSRSELVVAIDHTIADGRSALMLVHDLLTEYATVEVDAAAPPPPALRVVSIRRAPLAGGWRSRWWMLRRMVRLQQREIGFRQTRLPQAAVVRPQSQWVHWALSSQDTVRLVRRCRQEHTSLAGAQLAAVCCGLMDCLPDSRAAFKCQVPFDVRGLLAAGDTPVTARDLGCFISTMNSHHELSGRPAFWSLARLAHDDIQTFVRRGGPALYYNAAAAMMGRWIARRARGPSANDVRVTLLATNYGVVDVSEAYGSLRLRACMLTFKHDVTGPSLIMEAMVVGQRLNIGLAGDSLAPDFWDRLQIAIRHHLDGAAGVRRESIAGSSPAGRDAGTVRGSSE